MLLITILNNIPNFPESISHRKLNHFFKFAEKEFDSYKENTKESNIEEESLNSLLLSWSNLSNELLKKLHQNNTQLNSRNPKKLLSLGAMEAHINMAIQALKASEQD